MIEVARRLPEGPSPRRSTPTVAGRRPIRSTKAKSREPLATAAIPGPDSRATPCNRQVARLLDRKRSRSPGPGGEAKSAGSREAGRSDSPDPVKGQPATSSEIGSQTRRGDRRLESLQRDDHGRRIAASRPASGVFGAPEDLNDALRRRIGCRPTSRSTPPARRPRSGSPVALASRSIWRPDRRAACSAAPRRRAAGEVATSPRIDADPQGRRRRLAMTGCSRDASCVARRGPRTTSRRRSRSPREAKTTRLPASRRQRPWRRGGRLERAERLRRRNTGLDPRPRWCLRRAGHGLVCDGILPARRRDRLRRRRRRRLRPDNGANNLAHVAGFDATRRSCARSRSRAGRRRGAGLLLRPALRRLAGRPADLRLRRRLVGDRQRRLPQPTRREAPTRSR